jgi:uncharacterized membrane protein
MPRRLIGVLLLLVLGEALGVLLSIWFFHLFQKTVPPLAISSFNESAARIAFIFYGLGSGFLIFLLTLIAVFLSRFFKDSTSEAPSRAFR